MKHYAVRDQKVTQDDGGDPEPEGGQVPQGGPDQRGLLVNTDQ